MTPEIPCPNPISLLHMHVLHIYLPNCIFNISAWMSHSDFKLP